MIDLSNLITFWQYMIFMNLASIITFILIMGGSLFIKDNRATFQEFEPAFELISEFKRELYRDGIIDKPSSIVLLYQILLPGYATYKVGEMLISFAKFGLTGLLHKLIIDSVEELNKIQLGFGEYFGDPSEDIQDDTGIEDNPPEDQIQKENDERN